MRASLSRFLCNGRQPRSSSHSWTWLIVTACLVSGCGGLQGTPVGTLVVSTLASGLDVPWAMAFTPDGRLFFTERPGRLRVISGGVLQSAPVITLPVRAVGEGGLLGLAADPNFSMNGYLYTYYTYIGSSGATNRIQRLVVAGTNPATAAADAILLDGIPASDIHNGGRVKVGPDGMLYATAGDASNTAFSQDASSPAGKILRITRTGGIPADNPTPGSPIYTLGHRNPQGLAWDQSGALYATEHGPTSNDEVNHLVAGRNYGWPVIVGRAGNPLYVDPILLFSPDTCAPSGATFVTSTLVAEWNGDMVFTCLRGVHLHRIRLAAPGSDTIVVSEQLFAGTYGRLRDAVLGPDGAVYLATSNGGTDRLLRVGR